MNYFFFGKKESKLKSQLVFILILTFLLNAVPLSFFNNPIAYAQESGQPAESVQEASAPKLEPVELSDLRTETAKIYQNPDGSKTANVFPNPFITKMIRGSFRR